MSETGAVQRLREQIERQIKQLQHGLKDIEPTLKQPVQELLKQLQELRARLQERERGRQGQRRRSVQTPEAPAAIGPYSQAVAAGGWLYCSGQIPLDPKTGELVDGDVRTQTERVMENLGAVLRAAGASFRDVVKCTIYLVDMGDFAAVNEVYAGYFEGSEPPARACVAVSALPKGARVEIEAVAQLPESG